MCRLSDAFILMTPYKKFYSRNYP